MLMSTSMPPTYWGTVTRLQLSGSQALSWPPFPSLTQGPHLTGVGLRVRNCVVLSLSSHTHPCHRHRSLTSCLARLQSLGIAPSTYCTYRAGRKHFTQFCSLYDIQPWPASESTYCAHASRPLSHPTLLVYLAAIRYHHLEQGLGDPLAGRQRLA